MNATQVPTAYWVCVDCYCAANGLLEPHHGRTPDREPLSAIPDSAEVMSGLMWEEHEDPEGCRTAFEVAAGCECEHRSFSRSRCDGCGSTLGGTRDALTVWGE